MQQCAFWWVARREFSEKRLKETGLGGLSRGRGKRKTLFNLLYQSKCATGRDLWRKRKITNTGTDNASESCLCGGIRDINQVQ